MANRNGPLDPWAVRHQRSFDPEGGLEAGDDSVHDRETDPGGVEDFRITWPNLDGRQTDAWKTETVSGVRSVLRAPRGSIVTVVRWSAGFVKSRREFWGRVRSRVAVYLARWAARIAP